MKIDKWQEYEVNVTLTSRDNEDSVFSQNFRFENRPSTDEMKRILSEAQGQFEYLFANDSYSVFFGIEYVDPELRQVSIY